MISNYQTAKRIIQEIKKGEWRPLFNFEEKTFLIALKGDDELWINGPFFCELSGETKERFGIIFRHWVWWAAARQLKHNALHKLGELDERAL